MGSSRLPRLPILPVLLAVFLLLSACLGQGASPTPAGTLEAHFLDVGQADAIFLRCGEQTMLIDGGNVADSSLIVAYLREQGIQYLDYVVSTHPHEDHVGGLSGALSQFGAGAVYSPVLEFDTLAFSNFLKYARQQGLEPLRPAPGDSWSLGDALVTALGPLADYSNVNDLSIVLRVEFGKTSLLFTGDAEHPAEDDLLEGGLSLSATVLKVGHHGSDTSTSYRFLREVAPDFAVLSVGAGNEYGHPHDTVMSRLWDAEVTVYRTDLQGHIVAVSDGETVTFTPQRGAGADTNPQAAPVPVGYIGNLNSQVFHRENCASLPTPHNQIPFATRAQAVGAGFTPCGRCNP